MITGVSTLLASLFKMFIENLDLVLIFNTAVRASGSVTAPSRSYNKWTGLDDMSLAWLVVVQLLVFCNSGKQWTHE